MPRYQKIGRCMLCAGVCMACGLLTACGPGPNDPMFFTGMGPAGPQLIQAEPVRPKPRS